MAENEAERVPAGERSYPRWGTTLAGLVPVMLTRRVAAHAARRVAAQRQFGFRLLSVPWWFIPVPFLICNLAQWKNLLCGFQAGFIMSIPFSLLAYHALGRCRLGWFLLALASATIASFSTAMGLAVWPAGMITLHLVQAGRGRFWAWAAVGASEWLTYFVYYRISAGHTHQVERVLSTVELSVPEVLSFFIVLLGNPVASNVVQGALVGAFALLSLGACVYALVCSGRLRDNAMWLACVAQVLFTCLMISIGRAVLGIDYALEQRYNTHIVPFVVALLMLAASLGMSSPFRGGRVFGRVVYGAVLTMVVGNTVPSLLTAPKVGAKTQIDARNQLREAYRGGNAFSELLARWQRAGFEVDPAVTQ